MELHGSDHFLPPQCLFCGKSPDYAENFQNNSIISFYLYVTIVLHSEKIATLLFIGYLINDLCSVGLCI